MTSHKRRGSAFVEVSLLLAVFFFGTNFTAVKYVVESVPPTLFAAARFTLAGLLLLPVALLSGPDGRLARRDLLPMLGLVGVTATQSVRLLDSPGVGDTALRRRPLGVPLRYLTLPRRTRPGLAFLGLSPGSGRTKMRARTTMRMRLAVTLTNARAKVSRYATAPST
jgi:EamA-like transporter family